MKTFITLSAVASLAAGAAFAQDAQPSGDTAPVVARAAMQDRDGNEIGNASLTGTPSGYVWVVVDGTGLPPGIHGVHVHETGDCSADDFSSAGGHIAGDAQHGILAEGGPHPGDLPNAHVGDDGRVAVEAFNERLDLSDAMIFDEDGSAVVIHAGPDDYESQPAGSFGRPHRLRRAAARGGPTPQKLKRDEPWTTRPVRPGQCVQRRVGRWRSFRHSRADGRSLTAFFWLDHEQRRSRAPSRNREPPRWRVEGQADLRLGVGRAVQPISGSISRGVSGTKSENPAPRPRGS